MAFQDVDGEWSDSVLDPNKLRNSAGRFLDSRCIFSESRFVAQIAVKCDVCRGSGSTLLVCSRLQAHWNKQLNSYMVA